MPEKNETTPAYMQVASAIRKQIDSGTLSPGDKLRTQEELCEEFGMSRAVIRQALDQLSFAGILDRGQGGRATVLEHPTDAVAIRAELVELHAAIQQIGDRLQELIRRAGNIAPPDQ